MRLVRAVDVHVAPGHRRDDWLVPASHLVLQLGALEVRRGGEHHQGRERALLVDVPSQRVGGVLVIK